MSALDDFLDLAGFVATASVEMKTAARSELAALRQRVEMYEGHIRARMERLSAPGPNGCRLWTGYKHRDGYGYMVFLDRRGPRILAHRMSWMLNRGPIPDGLSVLHRCDVPACINPDHLFIGTQADNMRDCAAKGRIKAGARGRFGTNHHGAKLSESDVVAIRTKYAAREATQRQLAVEYRMSESAISQLLSGVTWSHLPILTDEAREALRR